MQVICHFSLTLWPVVCANSGRGSPLRQNQRRHTRGKTRRRTHTRPTPGNGGTGGTGKDAGKRARRHPDTGTGAAEAMPHLIYYKVKDKLSGGKRPQNARQKTVYRNALKIRRLRQRPENAPEDFGRRGCGNGKTLCFLFCQTVGFMYFCKDVKRPLPHSLNDTRRKDMRNGHEKHLTNNMARNSNDTP